MMKNLHCVNLVSPLSADKRTKPSVRMVLVVADTREEACRKVAEEYARDENSLVVYRCDFEDCNSITWDYQTWERADVAKLVEDNTPTVGKLAPARWAVRGYDGRYWNNDADVWTPHATKASRYVTEGTARTMARYAKLDACSFEYLPL
jgi:hypothetical protein